MLPDGRTCLPITLMAFWRAALSWLKYSGLGGEGGGSVAEFFIARFLKRVRGELSRPHQNYYNIASLQKVGNSWQNYATHPVYVHIHTTYRCHEENLTKGKFFCEVTSSTTRTKFPTRPLSFKRRSIEFNRTCLRLRHVTA